MQPEIIAHRGASYLAPENTLTAFRLARNLGADGVEFDVQRTKDGQLVIHHDYIIDFHTQLTGNIYDMLEGDLRALDFGSWKGVDFFDEKIPTLEEALAVGGELGSMMVELKSTIQPSDSFVPDVLETIRASGYADKVTLIAFQHDLLRQAREIMPELKVGALLYGDLRGFFTPPSAVMRSFAQENGATDEEVNDLVALLNGPDALNVALDIAEHPGDYDSENGTGTLVRWINNNLTMLYASFPGQNLLGILFNLAAQQDPASYIESLSFRPDWVSCEYHTAYARPEMVAQLHELGVKTAFWTPDTHRSIRALLPLGPDAIVTNRPDAVRRWMSEAD